VRRKRSGRRSRKRSELGGGGGFPWSAKSEISSSRVQKAEFHVQEEGVELKKDGERRRGREDGIGETVDAPRLMLLAQKKRRKLERES